MRPVNDLLGIMEDARNNKVMKQHFYWTKEKIVGLKWKGTIKGRTNNPKSKDGMRSGMVVFNELHQYENYRNIKVFVTGLGKKNTRDACTQRQTVTYARGPLDDLLGQSEQILRGEIGDNGCCRLYADWTARPKPTILRCGVKANPSLPYLPDLRETIAKEYAEWKSNPVASADFMTKRMGRPQSDTEVAVTPWENILATNRELPDMTGWECVAGIDYASVSDFASAVLHFRRGDERYDISHSWLCLQSKDLHRLTVPWRDWAEQDA